MPMCFVWLLKHWYNEKMMQMKWGKRLSEPFHVTNGIRPGISSGLDKWSIKPIFACCEVDLSFELNNIKAGSYVGEILLNHLMFADDTCVFCPSGRGLQTRCVSGLCRIPWNCFQLQQNSLHNI